MPEIAGGIIIEYNKPPRINEGVAHAKVARIMSAALERYLSKAAVQIGYEYIRQEGHLPDAWKQEAANSVKVQDTVVTKDKVEGSIAFDFGGDMTRMIRVMLVESGHEGDYYKGPYGRMVWNWNITHQVPSQYHRANEKGSRKKEAVADYRYRMPRFDGFNIALNTKLKNGKYAPTGYFNQGVTGYGKAAKEMFIRGQVEPIDYIMKFLNANLSKSVFVCVQ